jgi:tRNA-intron endonuclease
MKLPFDGDRIRGGREARERFYDSRGYGRPDDGGVALAPVEAAHLLFRGDLGAVLDRTTANSEDHLDFDALLASSTVSEVEFLVYKELRDRGFYLSPTHPDWTDDQTGDFVVYPRGDGPWDDTTAYRVWALSERAALSADMLREIAACSSDDTDATGVLAVVDEESEVTYLDVTEPTITGATHHDLSAFDGALLSDRVLVSEPPDELHGRAFYGQRLDRDQNPVQLSLVEAAYLAQRGHLTVPEGEQGIIARGRAVEGDRFDRRLRVYAALRTAGLVPKTGFKFGADFRTYADVESVESLGHSELLVRVLPADHTFAPRDLALDVRLAHGVRKDIVFALTAVDAGVDWLAVSRLTP